MLRLADGVRAEGTSFLPGNSLKVENFKNDMWKAVSLSHVAAGDAAFVQYGLDNGFTYGINIESSTGFHSRPNYASADEHRDLVDAALQKRIASGKTLRLGRITKGWRGCVTRALGDGCKVFSVLEMC